MVEVLLHWIFLASIPFALASSFAFLTILTPAIPLKLGYFPYMRWLPNTPRTNRIVLWCVASLSVMLYSGTGLLVMRDGAETESIILFLIALGLSACALFFLPGGGRPLRKGVGQPEDDSRVLNPTERKRNLYVHLVYGAVLLAIALALLRSA